MTEKWVCTWSCGVWGFYVCFFIYLYTLWRNAGFLLMLIISITEISIGVEVLWHYEKKVVTWRMNLDCHDSGGNFRFSVAVRGLQKISYFKLFKGPWRLTVSILNADSVISYWLPNSCWFFIKWNKELIKELQKLYFF